MIRLCIVSVGWLLLAIPSCCMGDTPLSVGACMSACLEVCAPRDGASGQDVDVASCVKVLVETCERICTAPSTEAPAP
jgi:hypothetical protein